MSEEKQKSQGIIPAELTDAVRVESRARPSDGWRRAWLICGLLFVPLVALMAWNLWFRSGAAWGGGTEFRSVYVSRVKAGTSFILGLTGAYYATYIVASLLFARLADREAKFHVVIWTIGPPLWFFFEWFIWFDNHQCATAVAQLRIAQDLASRLWAAVLAVMVSFRLGEIVKEAVAKRPDPGTAPNPKP